MFGESSKSREAGTFPGDPGGQATGMKGHVNRVDPAERLTEFHAIQNPQHRDGQPSGELVEARGRAVTGVQQEASLPRDKRAALLESTHGLARPAGESQEFDNPPDKQAFHGICEIATGGHRPAQTAAELLPGNRAVDGVAPGGNPDTASGQAFRHIRHNVP